MPGIGPEDLWIIPAYHYAKKLAPNTMQQVREEVGKIHPKLGQVYD